MELAWSQNHAAPRCDPTSIEIHSASQRSIQSFNRFTPLYNAVATDLVFPLSSMRDSNACELQVPLVTERIELRRSETGVQADSDYIVPPCQDLTNLNLTVESPDTPLTLTPIKDVSRLYTKSTKYRNIQNLTIGLLNVNSINQVKFDYLAGFLRQGHASLTVLTELTSENRDTIHLLTKHKDYPILTDPQNRRVGLMIPSFLRELVEIVDVWSWSDANRQRQSKVAIQMTTYKLNFSTCILTISAVYVAPDVTIIGRRALSHKCIDLKSKNPNYLALGDYNSDVKKKVNNDFFSTETDSHLAQIVKKNDAASQPKS